MPRAHALDRLIGEQMPSLRSAADVAALEAALRRAGVPLRRGARDGEGFRYLMVAAPDGVLVEAFEAAEGSMPPATVPWFSWA